MLEFSSIVPVLRVADLSRSLAWYQEILGFTPEPLPAGGPLSSCRLHRDGTELVLRRSASIAIATAPRLSAHGDWDVQIRLRGEQLVALLDQARRRTPLVRGPEVMPDGHVEFELEDPDGYRVCVAERLTDTRGIPRAV